MKSTALWALALSLLISVVGAKSQPGPPANDNFENRLPLAGTQVNAIVSNENATREPGEPDILGNAGGKSLWWTWQAPQNGTVTISTEGSMFDTLLAVYTGTSFTNLVEIASGDDSLGLDPLSSLVTFHSPSGTVYQIVVDGFQGFDGTVASGYVDLNVNFVFDRYTVTTSVNDTNRGSIQVSPAPDADGLYLVETEVTITALPQPGWFLNSWSGDVAGTNSTFFVTLTNNLAVIGDLEPILVKSVGRSPAGFEVYEQGYLTFGVWSPEPGTLNYRIDNDSSWLSVSPPAGTSRGETNLHTIYFGGLATGDHLGTVVITPLVEGAIPQSVLLSVHIDPQPLPAKWKTNFDSQASVAAIQPTPDGGFLIGATVPGITAFGDGYGGSDFLVLRLDAKGNRLWAHLFGGQTTENLHSLQPTSDGGSVAAGDSLSGTGGNKTSDNFGGQDLWVVRLDPDGNKLWDRSFGGSGEETGGYIKQTSDGGFVLAGSSMSLAQTGNKGSTNFGLHDFWVVRLDANGKRLWDRSFGGTAEETLRFLQLGPDGHITLGGDSGSDESGNKTNSARGYWIVRVDPDGNKLGEASLPCCVSDVHETADGGLVGIVGEGQGNYIVRWDSGANLLWQTYNNAWDRADIKVLAMEDTPAGGIQVSAATTRCCLSLDSQALTLDPFGHINRRQDLAPPGLFAATALARNSDGVVLLCDANFRLIAVQPQPDAQPTNLPHQSPLGFRFTEPVATNTQYVTEFSTNLIDWLVLQTNQVTATPLEIFDPGATNSPARFYRTRPVP